jgi:hypothetical protein
MKKTIFTAAFLAGVIAGLLMARLNVAPRALRALLPVQADRQRRRVRYVAHAPAAGAGGGGDG